MKFLKVLGIASFAATPIAVGYFLVQESDKSQRVEVLDSSEIRAESLGSSSLSTGQLVIEIDPQVPAVPVSSPSSEINVVPGLTTINGVLRRDDDDFYVGRLELDLGPSSWLSSQVSPKDIDGDSIVGTWWNELLGLVGKSIVVLGEVDDDDIDVYEVNEVTLRPLYSVVPPWSKQWTGTSKRYFSTTKSLDIITAEKASEIALQNISGVVVAIHIDINDRHPYWELDIRSTNNIRYDIEIDAVSGDVIEIDQD